MFSPVVPVMGIYFHDGNAKLCSGADYSCACTNPVKVSFVNGRNKTNMVISSPVNIISFRFYNRQSS